MKEGEVKHYMDVNTGERLTWADSIGREVVPVGDRKMFEVYLNLCKEFDGQFMAYTLKKYLQSLTIAVLEEEWT